MYRCALARVCVRHLVLGLVLWLVNTGTAAPITNQAAASWQKGPGTAKLKLTATVPIPAGCRFADGHSTMRLMQAAGEKPTMREMGLVSSEEGDWNVLFEFAEIGQVKEGDAGKLDAAQLLRTLNAANDSANEERKKAGKPIVPRLGWEQKPAFNAARHTLEWALRTETATQTNIQYCARMLGRKGVMLMNLSCEGEKYSFIGPIVKEMVGGFAYNTGQRYDQATFSDKVARGGLEGLITGESVKLGGKAGFWATVWLVVKTILKWILKLLIFAAIVAAIAGAYFFVKLYGGKKFKKA